MCILRQNVWLYNNLALKCFTCFSQWYIIPSGYMTSKQWRTDIDATSLCRINARTTSFWHHVSVEFESWMNCMLFLTPFVGLCIAYNYMKFHIRFLPCRVCCVCPSATHASRHARVLTIYYLLYYCSLSTVYSVFPTVTKFLRRWKAYAHVYI